MKIIDIDLKENGKKYFCKDTNAVFEVAEGNLIPTTRSFSMAELLKMDFEAIKEVKNPYTRVNDREKYCTIEKRGNVISIQEDSHYYDNELFSIANYFNNKEYAEYMAFKEILMRKLDRFAWDHNATVIDWDCNQPKHYIVFNNSSDNKLEVSRCFALQSNCVYFTSKDIAEQAIEEFKDDLITLYTWKFDF